MSQNKRIYYVQAYGILKRYAEVYEFENHIISDTTFLFSKVGWFSRFGKKKGTIEKFPLRRFCFLEPRDYDKINEPTLLPAGTSFSLLFGHYYRESYETF